MSGFGIFIPGTGGGGAGTPGAAATIAVGTVTTGAAGSAAAIVNTGTSSAAVFDFAIPRGDKGETGEVGSGGTGVSIQSAAINASGNLILTMSDNSTIDVGHVEGSNGADGAPGTDGIDGDLGAGFDTLWTQQWTEKFILNNPTDAYVSPSLPLSRNGTMASMDFYVTGTPASATTITVKQGAVVVGVVSLTTAGKATLTFATAVTGVGDDLFTYVVGGAGLVGCVVVCNQKWVNR